MLQPALDRSQARAEAPRYPFRVRTGFLAALLLALYFVLAVTASRTKSATFDEIVHVTAGYNAWVNHDQRFDPGNGDFVKRWATLPLLVSRPDFPRRDGEAWRDGDFFPVSRDFLFHRGNDPDAILLQTRSMVALIGVALGTLIFTCSRRIFGDVGGLVSVTVFAFCPHLLAQGALVSTDLTLTFALLAATWFLWRLLNEVSWPNLVASLLAFSLLVISKMSAVLIAPIAVLLIVARFLAGPALVAGPISRGRQFAVIVGLALAHVLAGWAAIWTVFEFKYQARADAAETRLTLLRTPGTNVDGAISRVSEFCHRHRLLPEGYLKGMEELIGISQRRPAFMNGAWHTGGRVAFFPYAFWAKTPPALLGLLAFGLIGGTWLLRRRGWLYAAAPLFALLAVYVTVALAQGLNIGHRHLLPIYPALYILAGSVALWLPGTARDRSPARESRDDSEKRRVTVPPLPRRATVAVAIIMVLVAGYVADSLLVRPHYLAYFSPLVGGPAQGYRRLADSSLDWGQDLPGLKQWLATHNANNRDTVYLSYFGTADPDHYDIASWRLPGFPEWRNLQVFACTPGIYAISATMFQQLYSTTFGPWNRRYEDEYQATIQRLRLTAAGTADNAALASVLRTHPEPVWQEHYGRYEKLRFARLCAWLRATHRSPDAQIGHSILIWQLDERALQQALWGAPVELRDEPLR